MHLLEAAYGLKIKRELDFKDNPDRPPNAHELLCAYCAVKGYITSTTGRWDEFRACKDLLKDFNDGRILFVAPPMAADGQVLTDEERWLQETERTMMKSERVAERLAMQRIREADEAAALESKRAEDELKQASVPQSDGSQMVFNDGNYEFIEDESALLGSAAANDGNSEEDGDDDANDTKREHKRLKHWGKKNRKLRDKNPYGEENGVASYVAYSTSRNQAAPGVKGPKVKRHDPRQAHGTPFLRTTLPHHPSAVDVDPIAVAKEAAIRVKKQSVAASAAAQL